MRNVAPLLVLTDPRCALHDAGAGHPERPERLRFALDAVAAAEAAEAPELRVVERLEPVEESRLCSRTRPATSSACWGWPAAAPCWTRTPAIGPHSIEAARLAAQAALEAVRAVLAGDASGAVCLTRPPGHHAESERATGFCVFNSAAVAAAAAVADLGCRRVLIFDPDVHHGNGTQEIFYARSDVLYLSLHQYPWYPWISGAADETGSGAGRGHTVNVPLPAGCGDAEYALAMEEVVLPLVRAWRPDLVIVSAGFDAHAADPLAGMQLSAAGLRDVFGRLRSSTSSAPLGLRTLEGGYARAVRDGVSAMLAARCAGHLPWAAVATRTLEGEDPADASSSRRDGRRRERRTAGNSRRCRNRLPGGTGTPRPDHRRTLSPDRTAPVAGEMQRCRRR